MKSLQIQYMFPPSSRERARYSDLQVLQSAAGWYIGTVYTAEEGWQEPGSRDSDYYPTEERAKFALTYLEKLWELCKDELCPEDIVAKWARQMYFFGYDPRRVGYRFTP